MNHPPVPGKPMVRISSLAPAGTVLAPVHARRWRRPASALEHVKPAVRVRPRLIDVAARGQEVSFSRGRRALGSRADEAETSAPRPMGREIEGRADAPREPYVRYSTPSRSRPLGTGRQPRLRQWIAGAARPMRGCGPTRCGPG